MSKHAKRVGNHKRILVVHVHEHCGYVFQFIFACFEQAISSVQMVFGPKRAVNTQMPTSIFKFTNCHWTRNAKNTPHLQHRCSKLQFAFGPTNVVNNRNAQHSFSETQVALGGWGAQNVQHIFQHYHLPTGRRLL